MWIDTHCHLDAAEFGNDRLAERARAVACQVAHCVIPAVEVANFAAVRALAHATGDSYCLGIHPLYVPRADDGDLAVLESALAQYHGDPRLVAVGEIGLDFFVPELCTPAMRARQEHFFRAQLRLARRFGLPVVLHVRRSVDRVCKYLRELAPAHPGGAPWSGIAHAFNGSDEQARAVLALGLRLGFGGAVTFERATRLRHLAQTLPATALVLETDAPDIAPQWLYASAAARQAGSAQARNTPAELPGIAGAMAALRGVALPQLARICWGNSVSALPRLAQLLV